MLPPPETYYLSLEDTLLSVKTLLTLNATKRREDSVNNTVYVALAVSGLNVAVLTICVFDLTFP